MNSVNNVSKEHPEKEIYDLVSLLAAGGLYRDGDKTEAENHLGQVVTRLNAMAKNLSVWNVQRDDNELRLNRILEAIVAISSLDFEHKAEVSDAGDIFDAVAVGLNALGEELESSTVSREFLDNILVSMVDSLIVVDQDAKIHMVNQSTLDLLGYTNDEILGQSMDTVVLDDEIGEYTPRELNKIAFIRDKEIYFKNKYGTKIPVSYSFSVVRDAKGRFQGAVCVGHDITTRKKAEDEMNQWAHIFQHVQSGVAVDNEGNGILDMVNPAYAAMLGYEPNEMIGMPVIDAYMPEFHKKVGEVIEIAHKQGSYNFEAEQITKDGTAVTTRVNATVVKDENNNILYRVASVTDISEQKEAENALRESETRYRTLFERSPFGVMLVDPETTEFIEFNDSMAAMLGYEKEEFERLKVADIEVIENPEDIKQRKEKILRDGHDEFETKLRAKDGQIRTVDASIQVIEISGKMVFLNIVRDITESKRIDEQIRKSLAEKEVLLQEIHHRVKNNLQIISSLLYLQSKKIEDDDTREIIKASQDRIKAMSLIHEKLYESPDLAKINLEEYIKGLMQSLFKTYGVNSEQINYEVFVDDISLGVDRAMPCGMIINELVSNTLKYAFPDGQKGEVIIEVIKNGASGFILSVGDNGIGFPKSIDFKNTDSLGLQLVNNLTDQLDGEISMESKGKGTKFEFTFDSQIMTDEIDA